MAVKISDSFYGIPCVYRDVEETTTIHFYSQHDVISLDI